MTVAHKMLDEKNLLQGVGLFFQVGKVLALALKLDDHSQMQLFLHLGNLLAGKGFICTNKFFLFFLLKLEFQCSISRWARSWRLH